MPPAESGPRPLAGRRVIVTRSMEQAGDLADQLAAAGAEPLLCPVIRFADPADWGPADRAIEHLTDYDWIVFTSANAVDRFAGRLASRGLGASDLGGVRTAAVGPATAARLAAHGFSVDLIPAQFVAEGLLSALGDVAGRRILIPRAEKAREVLPEELRAAGARVDVAVVYRTVPEAAAPPQVTSALDAGSVDAVAFASSSAVTRFAALFAPRPVADVLAGAAVACIGPVTAATARGLGLAVDVEPPEATIPALVEALIQHFGSSEGKTS
jgi:uroporphyrinogen-III synthase